MSHEHDLDAEYLYPSDAVVTGIEEGPDGVTIGVVVPCPECDEALELTTAVTAIEEADLELPLDDVEDLYD